MLFVVLNIYLQYSNNKKIFFLLFFYLVRCPTLHTSTVHKTASLADEGNSAYCQSSGAHSIYKPIEISIKRSPQHWCPNEGSNSELTNTFIGWIHK